MSALYTYLFVSDKIVIKANGKKIAEIKGGIVKKFNQKYFKEVEPFLIRSNIAIETKRFKK
jgi:hypothetical protein